MNCPACGTACTADPEGFNDWLCPECETDWANPTHGYHWCDCCCGLGHIDDGEDVWECPRLRRQRRDPNTRHRESGKD